MAEAPNIELLRRAFEDFARGDIDSVVAVCHPDVELREEPELPDSRTWHGHEGARGYWQETTARWSELGVEPRRFIEIDEATVVVLGRQLGRGAISGAEVESQFGHVYEFADGKIVRAAYYLDEQRALEAAGAEHEA